MRSRRKLGSSAIVTEAQARRAQRIGYLWWEYQDIDQWVRAIGYDTITRTDYLPDYTDGALRNGSIIIRDRLSTIDEVLAIAHEDLHHRFHPACTSDVLDLFQIEKQEAQANTYGSITFYPTLSGFETEEEFLRLSPMPERYNECRLRAARKFTWLK